MAPGLSTEVSTPYGRRDECSEGWRGAPPRRCRAKLAAMSALFPVGRVVAEPAALEEIGAGNGGSVAVAAAAYLARHQSGDFGDVGWTDAEANRAAASAGGRIVSEYVLAGEAGARLRVATETTTTMTLATASLEEG